MKKSVIIITGCDAAFYSFMEETLASLTALHLDAQADIGILDLGLLPEQVVAMQAKGYAVRKAVWHDPVPGVAYKPHELGLIARTELRDYFPGYSVYLWFDADAWAQTPEFYHLMTDGARSAGAAIVRENGYGCGRDWLYNRWWYGHMIASFGLWNGVRVAYQPAINSGILALSDTAPHWVVWSKYYRRMIVKRGKLNMDQHGFNAALELENLPHALMPMRCNWVSVLSTPVWNPETRMVCEPGPDPHPLSVIHLAGPDKHRTYRMKQITGGEIDQVLTYRSLYPL